MMIKCLGVALKYKKELTVIVLAINETFSLKETVDQVSSLNFVQKILIVSPKFVSKECLKTQKNLCNKYLNLRTIIQPKDLPGYGGAIKYCLKFINTKYFCWLDGDGETDPKYLNKMYNIIKYNNDVDIVNASRFKNKKILIKNYGYLSSIFTFFFQILCRILFNSEITDYTVGYRIYKTALFKKFNFLSNDQNFALESLILPILGDKVKVKEIYYQWTKRSDGKSHNSLTNKLSYFKIIYRFLILKIKKSFK